MTSLGSLSQLPPPFQITISKYCNYHYFSYSLCTYAFIPEESFYCVLKRKWDSLVVFIILIKKCCFQCKFHDSLIVTKRKADLLDLTMLRNTLITQYIHNLLLNWYYPWVYNAFKSSISNILWAMNVNF